MANTIQLVVTDFQKVKSNFLTLFSIVLAYL